MKIDFFFLFFFFSILFLRSFLFPSFFICLIWLWANIFFTLYFSYFFLFFFIALDSRKILKLFIQACIFDYKIISNKKISWKKFTIILVPRTINDPNCPRRVRSSHRLNFQSFQRQYSFNNIKNYLLKYKYRKINTLNYLLKTNITHTHVYINSLQIFTNWSSWKHLANT